ncbi:MAG: 23S rRNA (pseudouridine(1915)-N(3))-methyltransferase RlmH [Luteibaculum sp.]
MAIRVYCIGKTEKGLYSQLLKEYLQRIPKYCSFHWEELQGEKLKGQLNQAIEKESTAVLKKITAQDFLVLLDENGKEFGSKKFAAWIEEKTVHSNRDLVFVIGSAFGFSEGLKQRSNYMISLSKLTFNHQMVRGIFAEQLYRALNIINGGNYHHD